MDYNHIALFVRVVRAGSFTAAAAEAGLPKSSVSRSVARLEQDLGVRLLHRTTRQLALTEVGTAYYESVSASVADIDEADASAREHGSEPRGTVRLTAPPDFAALGPILAGFRRKYPGIRLELLMTSRFVDLVSEGVDLALRAGRLEDSTLVARRIGTTEMALFAAPAYLKARGRPRALEELPGHDWVLYRASNGRAALVLTGPGGERTVEVTGAMAADDMSFCRHAVEGGAGLALLPVHTVMPSIATGALEQVLPEWSHRGSALHVVLPTARQVPARVALLRDYLVAQVGQQLAETEQRCARLREPPATQAATKPAALKPRSARRRSPA